MSTKSVIKAIEAVEVLDSRGVPTVACRVCLEGGFSGFMQVPSGASTGQFEAVELRDGQQSWYAGKGVQRAVSHIEGRIQTAFVGRSFDNIAAFDAALCELDGTVQKSVLGANAMLAVSGSFAKALAHVQQTSLYQLLSPKATSLPAPMMNVINGGRHAANALAIQEFMLIPNGFTCFKDAVHAGAHVTRVLGELLKQRYGDPGRGDEGGFAPSMHEAHEALDMISEAVVRAGYGFHQVGIALDIAASEYCSDQGYFLDKEGKKVLSPEAWVDFLSSLVSSYPIVSIEDCASDADEKTWQLATRLLSSQTQLVGDDVFVSQPNRLNAGIQKGIANAILLKPNQVGTLSEMIATVRMAKHAGYGTIVSHRSGETEDSIIADLAVGLASGQIKTGPLRQSDRLAKYNRLLWIEKELGTSARYGYAYASTDKKEEVATC